MTIPTPRYRVALILGSLADCSPITSRRAFWTPASSPNCCAPSAVPCFPTMPRAPPVWWPPHPMRNMQPFAAGVPAPSGRLCRGQWAVSTLAASGRPPFPPPLPRQAPRQRRRVVGLLARSRVTPGSVLVKGLGRWHLVTAARLLLGTVPGLAPPTRPGQMSPHKPGSSNQAVSGTRELQRRPRRPLLAGSMSRAAAQV